MEGHDQITSRAAAGQEVWTGRGFVPGDARPVSRSATEVFPGPTNCGHKSSDYLLTGAQPASCGISIARPGSNINQTAVRSPSSKGKHHAGRGRFSDVVLHESQPMETPLTIRAHATSWRRVRGTVPPSQRTPNCRHGFSSFPPGAAQRPTGASTENSAFGRHGGVAFVFWQSRTSVAKW